MGRRRRNPRAALRVKSLRRRQAAAGMKRVEVVVPTDDAEAIRALAVLLRSGGKDADRIRARLRLLAPSAKRGTGADIVAMFQDSPFAELGIEIPHDMSVAKPIDI